MKSISIAWTLLILLGTTSIYAQVKIGNNPNTIDANSLLELESTNKGFLPPRVALNDLNAVAPLTGTVPAGMLVYSTGGTLANGFYYWSGSQWIPFISVGEVNSITSKTASATLDKSEVFVIASNDITLTLPAITGADNGLSITIKNVGSHIHQVNVVPSGSSTIDGLTTSKHFRWMAKTYVASGGNWIIKGSENRVDNVFDVSETGSWTTLEEIIEFLDEHMVAPSVVRLISGEYPIESTLTIDLDFPLTIQGASYGAATITAAGSLSGNKMFNCLSETYFKMLAFDGTGYGTLNSGEDAIHLGTNEEYYEIKDCTFTAFHKSIVADTNVEMWVFEVDIDSAISAGIEIAAGTVNTGVSLKISETDFIDCGIGLHFLSGKNPVVSVLNCGFYNTSVGQFGIKYVPATFTLLSNMFITNNTWNNIGKFMDGFDFTRSDGRDANTFITNNSGGQDKNPNCRINVNNNNTATDFQSGTWVKVTWASQTSITTKWTTTTLNRIQYQPQNHSDAWAIITGNIVAPSNNRNISIAIVKNGDTSVRFGETDLRLSTQNQPYQFATTVYLSDIAPGDYFELYCTSGSSNEDATFQDVQWFTETK